MTTQDEQSEEQIRSLITKYVDAARRKDLAEVMSCYARDLVAFDLMPPLRQGGVAAYEKLWDQAFSMTEGPFGVEMRDLSIAASGDVAFACALEHVKAAAKDGPGADMWLRWTAGLRRVDGAWRIVHEHTSVPIDMESSKGIFDLTP